MTARELWFVGLTGPVVAYALIAAIALVVAPLAALIHRGRPVTDDADDVSSRGPSWLVLGLACGALLAIADAALAIVIGASAIDRIALGGLLGGLACGPPVWITLRLVIVPLPALVIPFALNLLALWTVAYQLGWPSQYAADLDCADVRVLGLATRHTTTIASRRTCVQTRPCLPAAVRIHAFRPPSGSPPVPEHRVARFQPPSSHQTRRVPSIVVLDRSFRARALPVRSVQPCSRPTRVLVQGLTGAGAGAGADAGAGTGVRTLASQT